MQVQFLSLICSFKEKQNVLNTVLLPFIYLLNICIFYFGNFCTQYTQWDWAQTDAWEILVFHVFFHQGML